MTFRALLYAYVLGGLTFIPLLLVAIAGLGWTLLPRVDEAADAKKRDCATEKVSRSEDDQKAIDELLAKKHEEISEGGACGTFAVLRKYDFPAANAALIAKNNASVGAPGTGATGDGNVEAAKESESVYQSMYRSVFDRGKPSGQTSVLAAEEEEAEASATPTVTARNKRNATPANVFYIVLRHGHLMLYDSASQVDVRHVISLAHHSLSLSEGGNPPGTDEESENEINVMKDGDLFIKRTAIVLTPTDLPNGHMQSRTTPAKPFYLFSTSCSEKEDFYQSLLYTRAKPPIPEPLDANDTIKLQSTLHSTSLTPETRAINALFGRVFLGLYHTDRAKEYVQSKVEKKISRVSKPAFIASLAVKSIDLGDSAPVLSNPRLKDLHISGDTTIACDVKYNGGIKLTIAAVAKLDLGTRFKTRFVDLVLATSLQRLSGHLLVRIKPPPSNRLWFCFESPPEMDIKVEPVVSQRQITYTWILRQIEDKIRAVFSETLVQPNWDDVPWFDTRGQNVRGGIWRDEGGQSTEEQAQKLPTGADMLKERNSKTKSMPVLPGMNADTDSSAASSGSETASKLASGRSTHASDAEVTLKRRSIASLPAHPATMPPNISSDRPLSKPPPLSMRSPSYSSSTPSVALDESAASIDPAQRAETTPQGQSKWRLRAAAQQLPTRKEAVEAMREMRDKATVLKESGMEAMTTERDGAANERPSTAESEEGIHQDDQRTESEAATIPASPTSNEASFADRSLRTSNRTDTGFSSTSASSKNTQAQQRKQNILAATAAATNAAKNWSWNAYQTAKKNAPAKAGSNTTQQQPDGPMGRGQPLPPPGMPLPGPTRGLFGSFGGSVKRKPVLPPRKFTVEEDRAASSAPEEANQAHLETDRHESWDSKASDGAGIVETPASDEFGPWRENPGAGIDAQTNSTNVGEGQSDAPGDNDGIRVTGVDQPTLEDETSLPASTEKKTPPPLPRRRNDQGADAASVEDNYHGEAVTVDANAAPPAQSAEQAETKFALGADVGEEDFENAPKLDFDDEAGNGEGELQGDRGEDEPSNINDLDDGTTSNREDSDEVLAIPVPIDEGSGEARKESNTSTGDQIGSVGKLDGDLTSQTFETKT